MPNISVSNLDISYTQNFDTLSNAAGSTTNTLGIPGWYLIEIGGGARDNEQYAVDTGSSNSGDTYSYGTAGATERALGGLQSGSLIPEFGAFFDNNTGSTITSLDISYTGEQWRLGTAGRTDQLDFQYSLNPTDQTPTWIDANALDFVTPDTTGTGAKDGNSSAEQTSLSTTITGLNIAPGATFAVRWTDANASGSDDGLAVDNFSMTAHASVVPTVSIADASIVEGDSGQSVMTFTVTRSDNSTDFSVDYTTADGTASAGSDYVGVTGAPNTLHFTAGGELSQQVSITINGDTAPEQNESFAVQLGNLVNNSGNTTIANGSATGTILNNDINTHIYDIQGTGQASPLDGRTVLTQGVVTAISNGSSKGFYIQDVNGDGNAATSDGIFVFTGSAPTVHEGDLVNVTGVVEEYVPSGAAPGSLPTTEIHGTSASPLSVTVIGTHALPTPVVIGTDGVHIPSSDIAAANEVYESLEGMLVTVDTPQVVGPTNSFGEIFTVASNGADATGLNSRGDLLISGGDETFGYTDSQGVSSTGTVGDQNPERIQIDPGLGVTLPDVSTGAHLASVTGIVGYDFGDYQVMAKATPVVTEQSNLTKEAATLAGDANHLLVASYNAENLDPGDGAARFATIASEITGKLNSPDVVALQEIQDDSGPTDNGITSASETLQMIVQAINDAGGPQYAYIDNPFIGNDTNGGQPGGNIRTAFIYRTDRASFVSGSLATIAADGSVIHDQGSPAANAAANVAQQTDPNNPFFDSRPPLSATFSFNGQNVTVLSDHFASKGGSGALYGSQQPPFDAFEVQRAAQAQAVNSYVDSLLASDPNAKVLVAGDLNDFGFEQPLSVLKGAATLSNYFVPGSEPIDATAVYTPGGTQILNDLQDTLPVDQRFDYVYEGNAEALDHMLATGALAAGAQFQPVHINSEFYDQTSDHDPLIASFYLAPQLTSQVEVSGQQSFTLPVDGTLAVGSGPAIIWNLVPATTGTNATVDNAGAISATDGRGIDTSGSSNGNNRFTLINHAGASIVAHDDAIRINANIPGGVVAIDNAGTLSSATGQALDFNKITASTVSTTITNQATGHIIAADADAIRPGTNATINNHGAIEGQSSAGDTGNDGIDFQDAGYGGVHNFAGGSIVGARHGITAKLPITVDNDGGATITGQLGSGINLDTASDTTTTINNSGTITGNAGGDSDGDGIDVDGLIALNNHGLIEGLGTWNGGLSEAVTIGGGFINNYAGGTIHSVQRAITVDDSNLGNAFAPTTIYNEGTIQGDSGEAISITDSLADTLTNKGSILGSVGLGGGDDTLADYAGATFSGVVDGGAGTDTINLDGSGQGTLASFVNFEAVNVFGGDWTIGSESFGFANLESGPQVLRLAADTLADGHFDPTITGFGSGDLIDLEGIGTAAHVALGAGNVLTVSGGSSTPVTLQLDPTQDFSNQAFSLVSDNDGGTLLTVAPNHVEPKLKIILTNDDGYNAPGITTMYNALVAAGYDVHIVAPAVNQSAQGSSLGGTNALDTPIDITEFSPGNYYVDGKPATATLTGLDDLFAGSPPDLIISGTNRGDNIGESENISGTVNGAVQALFEGVPSIAVSTASFNGSYDTGFANAADFTVNFLQELQDAQSPGQPILPEGQGLTINVPGNPDLDGVSVTTITPESSASFPYAPTGTPNTYAEGFIPNTSPSGSPTSEGSQFLTNHITISPIDGNWGATEAVRDDLAVRLGSTLTASGSAPEPLNILLVDEDGYGSAGITATRDSLLAAGYNVTIVAPATDQSAVGSALYIAGPITVTQYSANSYSTDHGTPASLVSLALDPQGLLNGIKPDLVVVGADQGNAVGIENANHSATLGGAITALFNYDVPSIALTAASSADFATGANFLTALIENLQLTQGSSSSLLPGGVGLSINVPVGASADDFALTNIDIGTDANLSVLGNDNFAHFSYGAPVAGTDPHSEGDAYNAGKITVSPIDGSFAVHDSAAYDALANIIGTTYGNPNEAPAIAGDLAINVDQSGAVVVTTADLNEADPDSSGAQLKYTVTATEHGQVLVNGVAAMSFSQLQLDAGDVSFLQDGTNAPKAGFSVSLSDHSGLTASATVLAAVTPAGQAPIFSSPADVSIKENHTNVEKVMASDPDGDGFLFSITGGDDSDLFTINAHSGALRFVNSPDFETPEDHDGNNVYDVIVTATDSHGQAAQQEINVAVTDAREQGKTIIGSHQSDALVGTTGDDIIVAAGKGDTVDAGDGNDNVLGGGGRDTLLGGRGDDVISGGPGNDLINGGSGNDILMGSSGHDSFVFNQGFGKDVVIDFSHQDVLAFQHDLFANFQDVMNAMHKDGDDTVIVADAGNSLTLHGILPNQLHAHDFMFT